MNNSSLTELASLISESCLEGKPGVGLYLSPPPHTITFKIQKALPCKCSVSTDLQAGRAQSKRP